ncbi:response regulator [Pontibacter pamirensis]|uniref:response regulator n=1 Tax=Pontibacter pamirensis TaxID=2562824 RepID=UPI00138A2411|nr:response regulator [Pontibacter pamirensis]
MKQVERVLVIDDDANIIFLTKRLLSSVGIEKQVDIAYNGVEGLAHIREAAAQGRLPQLILLDIRMPEMDGFTFMEELDKLNLNLTDTKIVLLSSSQSPWDREKAAKSSAVAFLHKPLTKETLQSII